MEFVEVVVNVPVRGPFARARMDASAVDAAERAEGVPAGDDLAAEPM